MWFVAGKTRICARWGLFAAFCCTHHVCSLLWCRTVLGLVVLAASLDAPIRACPTFCRAGKSRGTTTRTAEIMMGATERGCAAGAWLRGIDRAATVSVRDAVWSRGEGLVRIVGAVGCDQMVLCCFGPMVVNFARSRHLRATYRHCPVLGATEYGTLPKITQPCV